MAFDHPLLAWGALAGLLPLVLHWIDRRRARPHPFAAIDFVLRSRHATARRLRLRRLLLLLLRIALLTALPLALARPRWAAPGRAAGAGSRAGPSAHAFVLDGSGSMRFSRGGKPLFARAQEAARGRLALLPVEDAVTVSICAPRAVSPAAPSFDRRQARAFVDAAAPSEEPVNLDGCLQAAAQTLADSPLPSKQIDVFTDLTAADWDLRAPPPEIRTPRGTVRPRVAVVDVSGGGLDNRAISDLSIEPARDVGPQAFRFTATVHNYSSAAVTDLPVELRAGGKVLARGFCDLRPGGACRKSLAASFPPGSAVAGAVAIAPDDLTGDDLAPFVLEVPRAVRVLVVDGAPSPSRYEDEAFFVQEALAAGPGAMQTRTVDPDELAPADLTGEDVVFLLDVRTLAPGLASALDRFVRRGGGLFFAVGDRVDGDAVNGALAGLLPAPLRLVKTAAVPPREREHGAPGGEEGGLRGVGPAHLATLDLASAVFSPFAGSARQSLLAARFWRYFLLEPPGLATRVLATFDDGAPAFAERTIGAGRVLLFTSSVAREWNDWPIRASFVPVIQQIVRELSGAPPGRIGLPGRVGTAQDLPATRSGVPLAAIAPSGRELPVRARAGAFVVEAPPEVGIYTVRVRRAAGQIEPAPDLSFAVGYDPIESDTTPIDRKLLASRFGASAVREVAASGAPGRRAPLWTELLALVAVAFFFEGVLLKR